MQRVKQIRTGRVKPPNIMLLGMVVLALAGAAVLTYSIVEDAMRLVRPPAPVAPAPAPAPAEPAEPTQPAEHATPPDPLEQFDAERAMSHIKVLSVDIGPRGGGSNAENKASVYIASQLEQLGYEVQWQSRIPVLAPDRFTQNAIATKRAAADGREDLLLVLGAHYDSVTHTEQSPGANDNGSGIAIMLEVARVLKDYPLPYALQFVAFGSEEMQDRTFEHHHYGSRHYVKQYLAGDKQPRIFGMLSIDMMGVGDAVYARTLGGQSSLLLERLQAAAKRLALEILLRPDARGESDHEAFAKAGIPAVWLERLPDPDYHTARDRYDNIDPAALRVAGLLTLRLLTNLTAQDAEKLAAGTPTASSADTPTPPAEAAEDLPPATEGLVLRLSVSGQNLVTATNMPAKATIHPARQRGDEPAVTITPEKTHMTPLTAEQAKRWGQDQCTVRLWREGDRLHFEATPRNLAVYINKRSAGTTKLPLSSLGQKPARIGFYFPANNESGYTVALTGVDLAKLPER